MTQEVHSALAFHSILFDGSPNRPDVDDEREPPAFFADLNLDQVIESITADRDEYDIKPFFYVCLNNVQAISYRHEVLRDLEGKALFESIGSFARKMRAMREHLAQAEKLHYKYQKESWFLDAAEIYCDAVIGLAHDLTLVDVKSRGLLAFRKYLTNYARSARFLSLLAETKKLQDDLAGVSYCLQIYGNRIKVSRYASEADYSTDVGETFHKFKRGAVKDYRVKFSTWPDMNHVEARVLELVARLYPQIFLPLDSYCDSQRNHLDATIAAFDREVQFYVAYLEYVDQFRASGLEFCYPHVSDQSKQIHAQDTFDLALANKLIREDSAVVCNDFYLKNSERIFVVSGPNQGGKTTFARTFGQLHYLASIGCLVPGREAQLFLFDRLFTHFEKEEDLRSLSGKLEDDLLRIHEILEQATASSIVIMNESFTSTTLRDALLLGMKVMEQIMQLDLLCVFVTFVDELASLSETTVSMVSTIVPESPAVRTYKLTRRPADGLAYAAAIAEKYGLTYELLKGRIEARTAS
jgi:hypothetical protein